MERILDGRVKLLDCQLERIKEIRVLTGLSYEKIALQYFGNRIARQTIYYICNPAKQEQHKAVVRALQKKKKYYNADKEKQKKQKSRNKIRHIKSVYSSS